MVKSFLYLTICIVFVSCASGGRKDRLGIRNAYQNNNYESALSTLESSEVYKKEKNKLLLHVEKGKLLFNQNKNYLSALEFQKAKDILEKLYTKSISKKSLTFLVNDNSDTYYGENFEMSMIHLYQGLNFFSIYKRGFYEGYKENNIEIAKRELTTSERRQELLKARAEIVSWNTLLENLQIVEEGNSVFKNDLMAKIFGALIHEEVDTSYDRQIALQLYKDAYKLLLKNYTAYKSFNENYENVKKDFEKVSKLKKNDFLNKYVKETSYLTELKIFLQKNILRMTKRLRPRDLKLSRKRYDIPKELEIPKRSNLSIFIEKDVIADKKPVKQYLSLGSVLNDPKSSGGSKILAGIGSIALTVFAANKLGLMPPPSSYNPLGAHLGYNMARNLSEGAAIAFEMPLINSRVESEKIEILIKNKNLEVIHKENALLANPLGDIAEESLLEKSSSQYFRLGTRLVIKHVSAIVASYATYKALKGTNNNNDFLARNAAVFQYLGASKAIQVSERADTRQWSTLPNSQWILDTHIPEGDYQVFLLNGGNEKKIGNVKIQENDRQFLTFKI